MRTQRDLSTRIASQSLMDAILDGKTKDSEETWGAGIAGKQATAAALQLLGPSYRVIHSIPIPEEDKDIDHIVIGPTGVFALNSKRHLNQQILVDDEYLVYNRRRYPIPTDAARDARRVALRLGLKKLFL